MMRFVLDTHLLLVVYCLVLKWISSVRTDAPCSSEIFCQGDILHNVQQARVFKDSKTFVDMKMKQSSENIIAAFNHSKPRTRTELAAFVDTFFSGPNAEFTEYSPTDWSESPALLATIKDSKLKAFAADMNEKWKELGRKIKMDVKVNPDLYSLIYMPYPFIIPGDRFREIYYWDSYWILEGILACGMKETALGMLRNFKYLVERFGLVPNGNRIYYTKRSQPPLFAPMVASYYKYYPERSVLTEFLPAVEKEYEYWMNNTAVDFTFGGRVYTANRYITNTTEPRPESYKEDYELVSTSDTDEEQSAVYTALASAAMSGHDFSSRWYKEPVSNDLKQIDTTSSIPVDLNSILYWVESLLDSFHAILGNDMKQQSFNALKKDRANVIMKVLWDPSKGFWADYNFVQSERTRPFYASSMFPMFVGVLKEMEREERSSYEKKIWRYIQTNSLDQMKAIPTSLLVSGQQWDYPNAWPPLQQVWVWALAGADDSNLQKMGERLAESWVSLNYEEWLPRKFMYEKYTVDGDKGRGGEYDVQLGFGWTNGVILQMLKRYPDMSLTEETLKRIEDRKTVHTPSELCPASGTSPRLQFSAQTAATVICLLLALALLI